MPSTPLQDPIYNRVGLPIELTRALVDAGCEPGGSVLNLFGFTGATGLAVLEAGAGRTCTVVEQDEKLVKAIRLQIDSAQPGQTAEPLDNCSEGPRSSSETQVGNALAA